MVSFSSKAIFTVFFLSQATLLHAINSRQMVSHHKTISKPYEVSFQINDGVNIVPPSDLIGKDTLYFSTKDDSRWDFDGSPESVGENLYFLDTRSKLHFLASLYKAKEQIDSLIFESDAKKVRKIVFQVSHKLMPLVIKHLEPLWSQMGMTLSGLQMELDYNKPFSKPDHNLSLEKVGGVLSQLAKTLVRIGHYGAAIPVYDEAYVFNSTEASNIFQIIAMIEDGDYYQAEKKLEAMETLYADAGLPESLRKNVSAKINLAMGILFYAQNKLSSSQSAFDRSFKNDALYFMKTLNERESLSFGRISKQAFVYYQNSLIEE